MDAANLPGVPIPPKRRWLRGTLWSLFAFLLLLAVPIGWLAVKVQRAWNQQQAVDAIQRYDHCRVYYERPGWVVASDAINDPKDLGEPAIFARMICPNQVHESRYNCDAHGYPWNLKTGDAPTWAERVFGKGFVRRAITVEVPLNRVGEVATHLKQLPGLRTVLVLPLTVDNRDEQEMATAVKWIEREVPSAKVRPVVYDFNISER